MSLENTKVVDAAGLENASNTVVLSILDSWDWEDEQRHLLALQEKLNTYFEFIESGQVYDAYPDAKGRVLRIDVIGRYPITGRARDFFDKAAAVASELNVEVLHKVHP